MRSLITGGMGFIGSHLAEVLLERGDEVTLLDNLSTGTLHNIAGIKDHPRCRHIVGSVDDQALVQKLVAQADVVFHLAAAVGVRLVVHSPVGTIETNVHGTETVLRAAAPLARKVLIASTSEVYGKSS